MGGEPKPMSSTLHRFLAKWTFSESEDDIFIVSILHLNVFFYSLAFWMQQPVLPFLTENLGADSVLFGYLQTFVSILLLIGGPIIGQLTDKLGSKFTLVLCQFGSALAYLTLGLSNSLTMLFISRIITITQQVMQTAQACINTQFQNSSNNNSNKSTKNGKNNKNNSANDESKNIQNRSEEATGRLSMSYGIGMIVGALLGGFIVKQFSLLTNIYISTLVSVIIAVIDIITLPSLTPNTNNNNNNNNDNKNDQTNKNKSNKKNGNNKNNNDNNDNNKSNNLSSNLYEIFELSMRSNIFTFLVFLFIGTAGVSTYRSMFSLIFKDVFKMEASNIGYYIAYSMSIATLSNSFLIAKLKTYFNNNISVIVEYNCIILAICLFLLGNLCHYTIEYPNSFISNNSIWFLCILAIPQSISSGTLYILANGYIRSKVSTDEMGKAVALTHALRSLNGALSPTIGGHLIGISYAMIGYFGAITQMISLGILKIYIQPYWKNTN